MVIITEDSWKEHAEVWWYDHTSVHFSLLHGWSISPLSPEIWQHRHSAGYWKRRLGAGLIFPLKSGFEYQSACAPWHRAERRCDTEAPYLLENGTDSSCHNILQHWKRALVILVVACPSTFVHLSVWGPAALLRAGRVSDVGQRRAVLLCRLSKRVHFTFSSLFSFPK